MLRLFKKIESGKFVFPPFFSAGAKGTSFIFCFILLFFLCLKKKTNKDLITKMLAVDPKKRITIQQLLQNPWFKQFVIPFNFFFSNIWNIQFFFLNRGFVAKEVPIATSTKLNVSDLAVDSAISGGAVESTITEIPADQMNAFDLASKLMAGKMNTLVGLSIHRETKLFMTGTKDDVVKYITKQLESMKVEIKMKENKLKCALSQTGEPIAEAGVPPGVEDEGFILTFTIEVTQTAGGFCLVEIVRGRGDRLRFNDFYRTLMQSFGEKIVQK